MTVVAIFDCDGTLYSAQFGRGMLAYAKSTGFNWRVRAYYAALLPRYVLRKLRLIPAQAFNQAVIANLGRLIANWDLASGAAAFEWIAREYLLATKRSPVISRLIEHQAEHHRVVLLSGVFTPCLELIAEELGVSDLVGTQVEIRDGRFSGAIVPPVINGKHKLPALQRYLASHGIEVDWPASYAYADSLHDRAVLETAGHPTVVHPDEGLLKLAHERNWEVIG